MNNSKGPDVAFALFFLALFAALCFIYWVEHAYPQEPKSFSPHCHSLTWDANPEPDVEKYCAEFKRPWDTTWQEKCVSGRTTTQISCQELGVTGIDVWEARLRAIDRSGNESERTHIVRALNLPSFTVAAEPPSPNLDVRILNIGSVFSVAPQVPTLEVGAKLYLDRSYTITEIPPAYEGSKFIQLPNNEKLGNVNPSLWFEIDQPAEVCVLRDVRLPLASWMSGYIWDGVSVLRSTDPNGVLRWYCQSFPAGRVELGGSEGIPQSTGNVVVVR